LSAPARRAEGSLHASSSSTIMKTTTHQLKTKPSSHTEPISTLAAASPPIPKVTGPPILAPFCENELTTARGGGDSSHSKPGVVATTTTKIRRLQKGTGVIVNEDSVVSCHTKGRRQPNAQHATANTTSGDHSSKSWMICDNGEAPPGGTTTTTATVVSPVFGKVEPSSSTAEEVAMPSPVSPLSSNPNQKESSVSTARAVPTREKGGWGEDTTTTCVKEVTNATVFSPVLSSDKNVNHKESPVSAAVVVATPDAEEVTSVKFASSTTTTTTTTLLSLVSHRSSVKTEDSMSAAGVSTAKEKAGERRAIVKGAAANLSSSAPSSSRSTFHQKKEASLSAATLTAAGVEDSASLKEATEPVYLFADPPVSLSEEAPPKKIKLKKSGGVKRGAGIKR
jgi:hypothetical protein